MSKKGLFIVIDGPSGSGKDSVVKKLLEDLHKSSIQAASIQETKESDYNREKILQANRRGDKDAAEAIIGERKKIYLTMILPMLARGTWIIANRGEPSTLAYQTLKQEITMSDVWIMHRKANILLPDLIVIINCDVQEALRRQNLRGESRAEKDQKFMSGKFTLQRQQVHTNYEGLKNFLKNKGSAVLYLKNDKISVNKQSRMVIEKLKGLNNL